MEDIYKIWNCNIEKSLKQFDKLNSDVRYCMSVFNGEEIYTPNILNSTCKATVSAIYTQLPLPLISFRSKPENEQLANKVSTALRSVLAFFIRNRANDSTIGEDLGTIMPSLVEEAYLTGRATIRVDVEKTKSKTVKESIVYRQVPYTGIIWDNTAYHWSDVSWIAFSHHMCRDEIEDMYEYENDYEDEPEEKGELIQVEAESSDSNQPGATLFSSVGNASFSKKTSLVWEIWDKETGNIFWINSEPVMGKNNDGVLKIEKPSIKFPGFFPIPQPFSTSRTSGSTIPTLPWSTYKIQAKTLSDLNLRLNQQINSIKVVGLYDKSIGDEFASAMLSNDAVGCYVPTDLDKLARTQGDVSASIWTKSNAEQTAIIPMLYNQIQMLTNDIYQITGVSDLMRGFQAAGETATATQMKNMYGQNRLIESKQLLDNFIVSMYELTASAISKLSDKTLTSILGQDVVLSVGDDGKQITLFDILRQVDELDLLVVIDAGQQSVESIKKSEEMQAVGAFLQQGQLLAQAAQTGQITPKMAAMLGKKMATLLGMDQDILDEIDLMATQAEQPVAPQSQGMPLVPPETLMQTGL